MYAFIFASSYHFCFIDVDISTSPSYNQQDVELSTSLYLLQQFSQVQHLYQYIQRSFFMVDRFERFTLSIFEITRYWHKISSDEMEKYGLKGPHCTYLAAMRRYPDGITAPQLGELCCKDKSDVSRMMNTLEKKGLVIKEGTNQNLYRGVYKLTEEGQKAADFVCERASLAVNIAGSDLTEENRRIFYESLELIAARLRELSKEGLPPQD